MTKKKEGGLSGHLTKGMGHVHPEDTFNESTVNAVIPTTTSAATTSPATTATSTPSGGGGSSNPPSQKNPNCNNPTPSVDKTFISDNEGNQRLTAYVPSPNSGVTIATGIDLHGRTQASMTALGWPTDLINKVLPYTTQQGAAATAYITAHPLTITAQQADIMDSTVIGQTISNLTAAYNAATTFTSFDALPANTQTAIADLAYQ